MKTVFKIVDIVIAINLLSMQADPSHLEKSIPSRLAQDSSEVHDLVLDPAGFKP